MKFSLPVYGDCHGNFLLLSGIKLINWLIKGYWRSKDIKKELLFAALSSTTARHGLFSFECMNWVQFSVGFFLKKANMLLRKILQTLLLAFRLNLKESKQRDLTFECLFHFIFSDIWQSASRRATKKRNTSLKL